MFTYRYLKDKSYYEDLYDKHTIEDCRDWIKRILDNEDIESLKKESKEEQAKALAYLIDLPLFFRKGDRYLKREETIQGWMNRDLLKDDFVNSHSAPIVYCKKCNQRIELIISELKSDINDKNLRMLFLYRCTPCNEKYGTYSDGEPYIFKGDFCPKCKAEWKYKSKRAKDKVTITNTCPQCGHKKVETLELGKETEKESEDPNFWKDREQFCLSEEEGEKYRTWKTVDYPQLKELADSWKDQEKHKDIYEQARNVKKFTISELSDLLAKRLEKADFKGLVITDTEMSRDLIVSFSIQDTKSGRNEACSKSDLKQSLKKTLDNTNWKLMSDGVSYKLGLLTGRLRGIDQEEVLVNEMKEERGINPESQFYGENGEIVDL